MPLRTLRVPMARFRAVAGERTLQRAADRGRGGGYSAWRDLALTRWREDPTRDAWGSHLLCAMAMTTPSGRRARRRTGARPERCIADLSEGRVQFMREDGTLATTLDVAVAAAHDAECAGHADQPGRYGAGDRIDLLRRAGPGLRAGDAAHPAFSKMFVETDWVEEDGVLLATRRRRAPDEAECLGRALRRRRGTIVDIRRRTFETDRARFLGRGRTPAQCACDAGAASLSNTVGCVLDPVFSLRRRVRVAPGARVVAVLDRAGGFARGARWRTARPARAGPRAGRRLYDGAACAPTRQTRSSASMPRQAARSARS